MWHDQPRRPLSVTYTPPARLPAKGRIEVIRYIRSNRRVELFGKRITVAEDKTHQYVTAIISVRARQVAVITLHGEIIHQGEFNLSRVLR